MLRFVDLSYYAHNEKDLRPVIKKIKQIFTYLVFLQHKYDIRIIKHARQEQHFEIEGLPAITFKSRNSFWHIPFKTHRYIADFHPDVVLVQGLVFPLQTIFLRWKLGKRPVFIAQHHGEQSYHNPVKTLMQKMADRYIDGYLFTSLENAAPWFNKKVIADRTKCYEVLEGTTPFKKLDKTACKAELGIMGDWNFIWVGRLNANKDPLTALKGFEQYAAFNPDARLYMVYQLDDLLPEMKQYIAQSEALQKAIILAGSIPNEKLPVWYSAMDFYLSGSHMEGSGFALMESMACGCIPVITNIPTFRTMTGQGAVAFLYQPGDAADLCRALQETHHINKEAFSTLVMDFFEKNMSFEKIAEHIDTICTALIKRKQ